MRGFERVLQADYFKRPPAVQSGCGSVGLCVELQPETRSDSRNPTLQGTSEVLTQFRYRAVHGTASSERSILYLIHCVLIAATEHHLAVYRKHRMGGCECCEHCGEN